MTNTKKIYSYKKIIFSQAALLFFIILLSIIPRFFKLISQADYYTGYGAGSYLLHSKSIVFDHHIQLLGQQAQETGLAQGSGVYYLLGIPQLLMDGNPFSGQVFMFVISLFIIIVCPIMIWNIFGKKEAIFIAIFLGISPYLNYHALDLWPPHVVPLLVMLYLIFLYSLLSKKKRRYYLYMTTALGFIPHVEIASLVLIFPSFFLLTLYLVYKKFIKLIDLFLAGFIIFLFFLPHVIFDVSHNLYNFKGLIAALPFNHSKGVSLNIFSNLIDRGHLFKVDIITDFPHIPIKLLFLFLAIILIGSYIFIKDKATKKINKIFILNLFSIISLSAITLILFPFKNASIWWIYYFSVIYIFITSIILSYFWNKKMPIYNLLIISSIFIFTKAEINGITSMINNEAYYNNQKYIIKIQEPIEYIYADSKNEPFKILYITKSTYVLDYKYMFWYIGHTKFPKSKGFKNLDLDYIMPGGPAVALDKSGQFKDLTPGIYYLIVEDNLIENGYASHFLTKPIGELLSSKTLNNNYIVQKYNAN